MLCEYDVQWRDMICQRIVRHEGFRNERFVHASPRVHLYVSKYEYLSEFLATAFGLEGRNPTRNRGIYLRLQMYMHLNVFGEDFTAGLEVPR